MAETIGSAQYELGADRTKLKQDLDAAKADVQEAGQQTEQQAQQSLGKLSSLSGPARAAIVGVGAAMGTVGGMALKMGQDYAGATNTLIRETGASGDALKALQTSMGNVARQVPEDMNTVALAVSNVSKKLQLQGPDLDAAAKKLLDYARINKIDVTEAINGVDDVMDRLKLPATELPGLLDKLTLAEQTTGIKATDLAASLAAVGPTLQNMGYDLDGSIALITQWQSIGGSTEELTKGMNKAFLQFSKEGATDAQSAMQMLIDKIKNAPTDMEATSIAAGIFGQKIGVTMATNIRNGGFDVAAFTGQIRDSGGVLDATTERTKTWGDRFHEFFNGIATQVGPLTGQIGELGMGFSGLTKVLTPLGGALGGLAGLFISGFKGLAAKVIPTAVIEGTAIGAATGEAEAVAQAEAATGTSAIARLAARIGAMGIPLAASGTTVGSAVGAAMGVAIPAGLLLAVPLAAIGIAYALRQMFYTPAQIAVQEAMQHAWEAEMASGKSVVVAHAAAVLDGTVYADTLTTTIKDQLADHTADDVREGLTQANLSTQFANDQALLAAGISIGAAIGTPVPGAALEATDKGFDGYMKFLTQRAKEAGAAVPRSVALGMADNEKSLHDEWKRYLDHLNHPFDAMKELSFLNGKLTGEKLAEGLSSTDPITHAQAEQMRDDIAARLNDLKALGYDIGDGTGTHLAAGINASTPTAVTAAHAILTKIDGLPWGVGAANAAAAWAANFKAGIVNVNWDQWISHHIGDIWIGNSPPPRGPLSKIDKGGENVGAAWRVGFMRGIGDVSATLSKQSQLPGLAPWGGGAPAQLGGSGGLSNTFNVNVTVNGATGSPQQIGQSVADAVRSELNSLISNSLGRSADRWTTETA